MKAETFLQWLGIKKTAEAPVGVTAKFLLKYQDIVIGTLEVRDGLWEFRYSDEFRKHGEMRTLVEFPDPEMTYLSKDLWQFFASRIPSPEQPEVEEIMKSEHLKEDDPIGLLRKFGRNTVANPFQLVPV